MKARGIFVSLLISLICVFLLIGGCSGGGGSNGPSSAKAITAYSLNGVAGTINEAGKTIAVTMPSLTNVYSMVATFTTTGASVKVGTTLQESGVTANNFTAPLTYTVTAADGSTTTYTVTITVNRAWHNPTSLSDNISPDGQGAASPSVATDNKGNAIIVWYQYEVIQVPQPGTKGHGPGRIFKSEYRNGVWTNPANTSDFISPSATSAQYPSVAMDSNGNAIIAWRQLDGTNWHLFKSEYRNGAWTHPTGTTDNISPDGQDVNSISLAMDNNDNAIIVWGDSTYGRIYKSEYRNGTWTNPASLSDYISLDGQYAFNPQVAMDSNGSAIIVWYQHDNTSNKIFKSEYRNGTWHHPLSLSDNINPGNHSTMDDEFYPQVAMDDNGNAIIVWDQADDSGYYQIFKSEYRNGAWHHPANLADNISPEGQSAGAARVAMDNNGNAIIIWVEDDGSYNYQIYKSEYRNGAWHHPANLSDNISPDGSSTYYPEVAMDNNGNAIIVWGQEVGTNNQVFGANIHIFKSEYRKGVWTNPTSLSDYISPDGQYACIPVVAMSNSGNAIIVWQQYGSDENYHIFKSEYR